MTEYVMINLYDNAPPQENQIYNETAQIVF